MPKKIRSAIEVRNSIPVGDAVVSSEIDLIGDSIESAVTSNKLLAVIESGSMAGEYSYGNWWLMEKIFDYETWKGNDMHAGVLSRLSEFGLSVPLQLSTVDEVQRAIPEEIKTQHKQINKVLAYFRGLGYNIHPGNWFNADEELKVKWVVNWNSTVSDHIYLIDDTIVIGKPEEYLPVGRTVESLEPAPVRARTRIDFFGSGNTGVARVPIEVPQLDPVSSDGLANVSGIDTDMATAYAGTGSLSEGLDAAVGDAINAAAASLAARINSNFDVHNEKMVSMFNQLNRNRLVKPVYPDGVVGSYMPGVYNTGDGYYKDLANIESYDSSGNPLNDAAWKEASFVNSYSSGGGGLVPDDPTYLTDGNTYFHHWNSTAFDGSSVAIVFQPGQPSMDYVRVNGVDLTYHGSDKGRRVYRSAPGDRTNAAGTVTFKYSGSGTVYSGSVTNNGITYGPKR